MKKYSLLENSSKLSQIEARLTLYPYLSKGNLPSGSDAKVFFFLQKIKKIPNKRAHPNVYHWYILMKQFSSRTLELWQKKYEQESEEDRLVTQYIETGNMDPLKENKSAQGNKERVFFGEKLINEPLTPVKTVQTPRSATKRNVNFTNLQITQNANFLSGESLQKDGAQTKNTINDTNSLNLPIGKNQNCSPSMDVEYVMEMQLKTQKNTPIKVLKQRLEEQKLQLLILESDDGVNLRVVFKTEKDQCQKLKDRISKWHQVSNLQFRKQKKGGMGLKAEAKSQKIILSPRQISSVQ